MNASQLSAVNALFRRNLDFTDSLPVAAIAALGLVYFMIVEGLLLPAGRAWQSRRAGEPGAPGFAHIGARLALALVLATLVGGLPLLILALLIVLQQAVAGLAAHPIGGNGAAWAPRGPTETLSHQAAHTRFALLWGGLLPPLRFYTGVLVWLGPAWSFTILLLLFCVVAFLSVGLRAAQRARQARIQTVRGEEPLAYDLQRSAALAARRLSGGRADHGRPAGAANPGGGLRRTFQPAVITVYGHCKVSGVHYSHLGLLNSLLLTFDLLLLGLVLCAWRCGCWDA